MGNLLTYILQVNLLLIIVYLGYQFLLKRLTFYSLNRAYLIIGALYALVYPLLDVKSWFVKDIVVAVPILWDYVPLQVVEEISKSYSIYDILLMGITIGAALFVVKLIIQLVSLLRIHHHSKDAKWHTYLFRDVLFPIVPFSFFNKIYIHKAQHKEIELHDIFEHEYIHVKGLHSCDVLLFEMLLIVCWYNPFVWLMRKAVRQNLEFLTDQQVLNKGVDRQTYQYSLLHVTHRGAAVGISNQFNFQTLKKRIMMMNKKRSSRLELSKYAFLLPIMLLAGASFTVSKAKDKIVEAVDVVKETAVDVLLPNSIFNTEVLIADKKANEGQLVDEIAVNELDANDFIGSVNPVKNEQDTSKKAVHQQSLFRKLKSKSEIDFNNTYWYEYDGKSISKNEFMKIPEADMKNIMLFDDQAAFKALYGNKIADVSQFDGFVRANSIQGEQKLIEQANNTLIIVDGIVKGRGSEILKNINPNDIESMSVIKGHSAHDKYGEEAKDGVIELKMKVGKGNVTKKKVHSDSLVNGNNKTVVEGFYTDDSQPKEVTVIGYKGKGETIAIQSKNPIKVEGRPLEKVVVGTKFNLNSALIILDGVDKGNDYNINRLNPNDIESISVLKDSAATAVYADKGKDGVIIITTKKKVDTVIIKAIKKEIETERQR